MANWGGKRKGAGRKKDPDSMRAKLEIYPTTAYHIRRNRIIHAFDAEHGTEIASVAIFRGALRTFEGMRLAQMRVIDESNGTRFYDQVFEDSQTIGWRAALKKAWNQAIFFVAIERIKQLESE